MGASGSAYSFLSSFFFSWYHLRRYWATVSSRYNHELNQSEKLTLSTLARFSFESILRGAAIIISLEESLSFRGRVNVKSIATAAITSTCGRQRESEQSGHCFLLNFSRWVLRSKWNLEDSLYLFPNGVMLTRKASREAIEEQLTSANIMRATPSVARPDSLSTLLSVYPSLPHAIEEKKREGCRHFFFSITRSAL